MGSSITIDIRLSRDEDALAMQDLFIATLWCPDPLG
jgi:hypothetical protein